MSRVALFSVFAALSLPSLSPIAYASPPQPSGAATSSLERVLLLKDGSIYRGEVVELVPREYIVLKLHSGAEKRFAWSSIERQTVPGSPATEPVRREASLPPPPLAPAPQAPPRPAVRVEPVARPEVRPEPAPRPVRTAEPVAASPERATPRPQFFSPPPPPRTEEEEEAAGGAHEKSLPPPRRKLVNLPPDLQPYKDHFVHLKLRSTEKDLRVEYISDRYEANGINFGLFWPVSLESWRVACEYPCGEYVYRNATFRVTGPEIVDSERFVLPKTASDVELRVKPGRPAAKGFGITLDIIGAAGLAVGVALLIDVAIQSNTLGPHGPLDTLFIGGLTSTIISGGLLAGGIALTVRGQTKVSMIRRQPVEPSPQVVDQAVE